MEFKIELSNNDIKFLMEEYDYDNLDARSWNLLEYIRFQIKKQIEELEERAKRNIFGPYEER